MPTNIFTASVTDDHAFPVEPLGGTATVMNASGDTIYYADNAQVSATNNQGSLTAGNSQTFSSPQWLRSLTLATVKITVTSAASSTGLPDGGTSLQVVGKDDSGTPGWLNALSVVLRPSGDASGATDVAAINAALAANANVIIHGGQFFTNAPIIMNSGNALTIWNARVSLTNGANCNIIHNHNADQANQAFGGTADSSIRVKGIGYAWLDGNAANQATPTAPYQLTQVGVFFVNATDVIVEDVVIGPVCWMAGLTVGCSNVRWSRVYSNQDRSVPNQDAIDVGPGCSNIQIEHLRGTSGDDCHSIWAKHGAASPSNLCPWLDAAWAAGAANLNTSDVRIINTNVDVGINCVRVQAGDGATLSGVHVSNFVKRGALLAGHNHSVLQFGTLVYVTTPPTASQLTDITLDGFSGPTDWLVGADSNFQDVVVKNAHVTGPFTALMGHTVATATNVKDVEIDVNTSDSAGASNYGLQAISGDTWDRIRLRARMKSSKGVLFNAGTVTNVDVDAEVDTPTGAPIKSTVADTGLLRLKLKSVPPSSTYANASSGLAIAAPSPIFRSGDVIPQTIAGSEIICDAGIDPTGGAHTAGAKYIADGYSWNRILDLAKLGLPTVTSVTPSSGTTAGGTSVVIAGTNFSTVSGAAGVKFGGTNAASYSVDSATQITATTPASAGAVDVVVTNTIGSSPTGAADRFSFVSGATPAFVRAGGNALGGGSSTLSLSVPAAGHAAGNTLIVVAGVGATTVAPPTSVTDSKGNTYTIDATNTSATPLGAYICSSVLATPLVSGDTVTVHWAAAPSATFIDSAEFSNIFITSPLDQISAGGSSTSAVTSLDSGATGTLSQAKELAISIFMLSGTSGGGTMGGGFTKIGDRTGTTPARGMVWGYLVTAATTAIDETCTIVNAHAYSAITATYKGA